MLTLFAVPRGFDGNAAVAQINAIESWRHSVPQGEIFLFGDDPGVADVAETYGATHVPHIERSPLGAPLLSSMFAIAQARSSRPYLCFINADIILLEDFRRALEAALVVDSELLLIASRFNLNIPDRLVFTADWSEKLRARARAEGRMYAAGGSDLFLFRNGFFRDLPPFAVGRGYYDNWLLYHARRRGARLIDATAVMTAVHPDHDYAHIPGLSSEAEIHDVLRSSEDARRNLRLAGGARGIYTAYDATHVLDSQGRALPACHPRMIARHFKAHARRIVAAWRNSVAGTP